MKKVGIVLSGCGVYDGVEIHEAVLTMLELVRQGAKIVCFAPNSNQTDVINHFNGQSVIEKRNVLIESARVARGKIFSLEEAKASSLDALIVPGGFGVVKNLSNFAVEGRNCNIDNNFKSLVLDMHAKKKPLGFICIAPALLPKIFNFPLQLTIGVDIHIAKVIESMGSTHIPCTAKEIVIDQKNRIVSTPAYMLAKNIAEVAEGIRKLVNCVLALIESD